ncbi:hypothetical protein KEM55_004162 [Ascosphaera atra]|nr:hypothetical protein KEM55_004162 [Ascosphaera atra]
MSGVFKGLFGRGGDKNPTESTSDGFVDFTESRVNPVLSAASATISNAAADAAASIDPAAPATRHGVPVRPIVYTKWYRIWERTTPSDFLAEAIFLPCILLVVLFHMLGMRRNRRRANVWAQAHLPTLQDEFALVGFGRSKRTQSEPLSAEAIAAGDIPKSVLRERAGDEFGMYASGRLNVAFVDITIRLNKMYNPFIHYGCAALGLLFEPLANSPERVEMTAYAFDGHEADLVRLQAEDKEEAARQAGKHKGSTYDGFVFAVVHKNRMRKLREERYDISLTQTKDSPKLPEWATTMSESAEITDTLLTPELIKAVEDAGENVFEHLIVTDQPTFKPEKLVDLKPRKRATMSMRLPSGNNVTAYATSLPLVQYFLTLPDRLVAHAHFRPEVMRKVRAIRDSETRKLKRAEEEAQAEERKVQMEKTKREERDRMLRNMSADEQRKFLEKEKEKELRKGSRRRTMRA